MEDKWPTFNMRLNNSVFWRHEWSKHGTCASKLESMNSIPKYFSKGIELLDVYNAGDMLKLSGIVPRMEYEYNIEDIVRAIESSLQHNVTVMCAKNKINQKNYLREIHMCFDKSLKLVDCDVKSKIKCQGNQVIYPEILKPCE